MRSYRRVLAAIDIDRRGETVARQAWRIAQDEGARFALAHIADYGRGFESDHAPFLTPQEVEGKLEPVIRRRLTALAGQIGADGAAVLVGFGDAAAQLPALALNWQPDLLVVGLHAPHGLDDGRPLMVRSRFASLACDTLVLPAPRRRRRVMWGWAAKWLGA